MSTFKKLLALTLALAMVLSVSAFAGNYKADTYADAADIDPDCEDAVELMYALDIMVGDGKNFNPKSTVTRAEMAKMIYVVLNYGEDDEAVSYKGGKFFSDVATGAWYEGYVNYAAATKLVQGRPDGTFGPMDPVTTAEAAKMLLTAIGYSAEARGYTGAKWADNVLSDAAIIGLLSGYKSNVNTYAPRQWVAVMFENALLEAYTFGTMRPTFSGLLTSGGNYEDEGLQTLGEKYYGFVIIEGEMTGTKNAELVAGAATKDSKYVRIDGELVRGTDLDYMDLGEEYKVIATIYDFDDGTYYYKALSTRNTGAYEVAYAEVQDITYDINYKVSSNDAANKYVFTVDGLEAKTDLAGWLTIGYNKAELNKNNHKNANDLKALAGEKSADMIKAVANDDGDIKYIIEVQYTYANVTDVVESTYYGEYVVLAGVEGTLKAGTLTRWYVEEMFADDYGLEEGNYLKMDYDPDNTVYNVEILPVDEEVTYDERTKEDGEYIYTLGGSDYYVGIKGFEYEQEYLKGADFDDLMDVVYDGDLVIYAEACKSYNTLDDVNAMLGLVIATSEGEYDTGFWHDRNGIRWMDINGDLHEAEYVDYNDSKNKYNEIDFTALRAIVGEDATVASDTTHAQLVIIHQDGNKVWAELIEDPCNEQLDVTTTTLKNYIEENKGTLDTEDDVYVVGSGATKVTYKIETENKYFVGIEDDDEIEYKIMAIDELADGYDENTLVQVLTKGSSVKTIRAGFVLIDNLHVDAESSYLYTVSALKEKSMTCDVMFPGADAAENVEIELAKGVEYAEYTLYEYSYDAMDKVYTLKEVDWTGAALWSDYVYTSNRDGNNLEMKAIIGNTLVMDDGNGTRREVSLTKSSYNGEAIQLVVVTNIVERKANSDEPAHDDIFGIVESTIEFVTVEELAEMNYANGDFAAGVYNYSDILYSNADGLTLVTLYQTQDEANMAE